MKIKRKIYWNLCLVALLAMAVSALITALLLCQGLLWMCLGKSTLRI